MGCDPEQFWRLTPREIARVFEGAAARAQVDSDRAITIGHMTAALGRVKKFPRLSTLLSPKKPKPKRGQSKPWQDQLAAWGRALTRK
ncbi:phage tail assembly chaperone [Rhizorhabdus sp.]|uniref:phage tail assembly chaperone n=1 Tax=Rhizorhabdus sp. TaxID=1968843 RepID=UPI0035B059CC